MALRSLLLLTFICLAAPAAFAQDAIPRPEHPRPDALRAEWLNLNGPWEYTEVADAPATDTALIDPAARFPEKINVPFPREAKLSGIERRPFVKNVWYRRDITVPAGWTSPRVRLNIGAADWRTTVWVNGQLVGEHTGGNVAFGFDITHVIKRGEANRVVIRVFDDTASGLQSLGKQSTSGTSFGILYTSVTGIWQTVWLEGVGDTYVTKAKLTPVPEDKQAWAEISLDHADPDVTITAEVHSAGKLVAGTSKPSTGRHTRFVLNFDEVRLWSPEDPHLYDVTITLRRGEQVIDQLKTYFGMRTVSVKGMVTLLNGKPFFQRHVLDQGYYPDGIWTSPSDAAFKQDIENSLAMGFNGARLHQKVFEPRLLYWADKLGYTVWGEFPNLCMNTGDARVDLPVVREWVEIVDRDYNHPAIIGWAPFNEAAASAIPLQNTIMEMTRALDSTRLVKDTSGWVHNHPDPDVTDAHDGQADPLVFKTSWDSLRNSYSVTRVPGKQSGIPFSIGEYGGIGYKIHGTGESLYGNPPKNDEEFLARYKGLTDAILDNPLLGGFCYIQLNDVEQEQNGLYTDRREPKLDPETIKAINTREAAYEKNPPYAP